MTRSYAIMLDAIGADTDNIPRHAKGRGVRPVADMETGAATEGTVIAQGLVRQDKGWWSFAYVSQANLASLADAAHAAGLTRLQYWVANWNLDEAEAAALLGGDIVAVQWASPTSNPDTIVPGGTQTLADANIDISVTIPSWFAYKSPGPVVTRARY